jgi:hypothetical protein
MRDGAIYAAVSDRLQVKEMAEKAAEIDRLREALKKIVAIKNDLFGSDWAEIEEARNIASEALGR